MDLELVTIKDIGKKPVIHNNCNKEIEKLFNELRQSQIQKNPLNFYLWVPLQNLKSCI